MSMSIPREENKSLASMTLPELHDLLRRQEKLVANKNFVSKLPDKGDKILSRIAHVKEVIKTHEKVDETEELFEKMTLNADYSRRGTRDEDEGSGDILGAIINNTSSDKVVIDERNEKMHLPHSYVRVIKTPNKELVTKERFRPNITLVKKIQSKNEKQKQSVVASGLDSDLSREAPSSGESSSITMREAESGSHSGSGQPLKLKHRYDDSLEADMRRCPGIHEAAKLISIEESVTLQRTQKQNQEEYQNKQAMEKLAQRLGIKMASFDPEGSRKMAYREREVSDSDDDEDGDGDNKEIDYPDEKTPARRPVTSHSVDVKPSILERDKSRHVIK